MSNYVITSDTTCDLPLEYTEKYGIDIVPLYYMLDDVVYGEEINLTPKEFYQKMRGGKLPTTMAVNPDSTRRHFVKQLEAGFDILHIAFSSGLSSSYETAYVVGDELSKEYPDRKIIVIDSKCASMGQGLFVHKAVMNREKGMSLDDNAKWLEENKLHVCHQFTVDDLHHLHRGGRVSKASGFIGGILGICPLLNVNDEGKLIPREKVRGKKRVITRTFEQMKAHAENGTEYSGKCYISNIACRADAEAVASLIEAGFPKLNGKVQIYDIGTTIGSHTGPGTVALFFWGDERQA